LFDKSQCPAADRPRCETDAVASLVKKCAGLKKNICANKNTDGCIWLLDRQICSPKVADPCTYDGGFIDAEVGSASLSLLRHVQLYVSLRSVARTSTITLSLTHPLTHTHSLTY
jgi:hypothetical protein